MARPKVDVEHHAWPLTPLPAPGGCSAAEEIAHQVQRLIVERDVPEGTRLPSERDMAHVLGTSRPTVSQAIRVLVVRGLVESRRGSGAYVVRRPRTTLATAVALALEVDQDSVAHLADLRLGLEIIGITQAIEGATGELTSAAELALERLRASVGVTADWVTADTHFHATLVRGSHNPYLAAIFESVHGALIYYEYRSWMDSGVVPGWLHRDRAAVLMSVHEPMVRALQEGDVTAARLAVRCHHTAMTEHLAAAQAPEHAAHMPDAGVHGDLMVGKTARTGPSASAATWDRRSG